jgi:DNA-directed RNA polymerase subunit RPC12/RpoP
VCVHCGRPFHTDAPGTAQRNHCPHCLHSLHLDMKPGDRRSGCRGVMEPVAVWVREGEEWALIHRCLKCGLFKSNRIAGDDNEIVLLALGARALTKLPFPLDGLKLY